jgi:hypothetical protein
MKLIIDTKLQTIQIEEDEVNLSVFIDELQNIIPSKSWGDYKIISKFKTQIFEPIPFKPILPTYINIPLPWTYEVTCNNRCLK